MNMKLTESQEAAKRQFIAERGAWKWSDMWETILCIDEEIIRAYSTMSSVPHKKGVLPSKVRELVCIAIDASITHLQEAGLRNHILHALEEGATKEEIVETLEICSTIGSHTLLTAMPLMEAQLKKRGKNIEEIELTEEQEVFRNDYKVRNNGYWPEAFEVALKLDEEYLRAFSSYADVPYKSGSLEPKYKELIWIAVDASPSTVYQEGLEYHIGRALDMGATTEEILAVFEIIAGLGVHSITVGVPILSSALEDLK